MSIKCQLSHLVHLLLQLLRTEVVCCVELMDIKASSGWVTAAFALLLVRLLRWDLLWCPSGVYLLQHGIIHGQVFSGVCLL